jgi:hypothetical protein
MSTTERPFALCPGCGAPLISTLAFTGFEFVCLECGKPCTFFGARPGDPSPELTARYEGLRAEWDEHVAGKLLSPGARHRDCETCSTKRESHITHATDEEMAAHEGAVRWFEQRAGIKRPGEGSA